MNKGRLEPLGVPGSDYDYDEHSARSGGGSAPNALDRWVLAKLTNAIPETDLRIVLWDTPPPSNTKDVPAVQICDRGALYQVVRYPELHFGDLYSSGRIRVFGDLLKVLDAAYRYIEANKTTAKWVGRFQRLTATPSLDDSRRNIHHHYDIGNEFYRLWLDREALQYTCAYYPEPDMTIEQAQQAKMHHVCRKLQLKEGDTVAEAGGGWGGFALFMAENYGARVRSFNISKEQIAYSREWAKQRGLEHLVEFVEDDFRNISGRYDAFVSIGMLEHAGAGNYPKLGKLINRVLSDTGRGLIHTIGRDRAERLNPWIDKRIFPGAYPPTLREMMDIFEPNGLSVLDVENIRLHYAKTLQAWLDRYEENIDTVQNMFDQAFVRGWRLYLAGSIMAFLHGKLQLFQVSFARSGMNDIPNSRAHIYPGGH
ncbi:MAG: cyclopropane-fatty-acyl-phospholipid synthase family protein [Gammaproteobacteria bacterium]